MRLSPANRSLMIYSLAESAEIVGGVNKLLPKGSRYLYAQRKINAAHNAIVEAVSAVREIKKGDLKR